MNVNLNSPKLPESLNAAEGGLNSPPPSKLSSYDPNTKNKSAL